MYRFWAIRRRLACDWNLGERHSTSRSYKMAPFDKSHMSSYWRSTVAWVLSCIVSEIGRTLPFLPRDAVHSAALCRRAVGIPARPPCNLADFWLYVSLIFSFLNTLQISVGLPTLRGPTNGCAECRQVVWKKSRFCAALSRPCLYKRERHRYCGTSTES